MTLDTFQKAMESLSAKFKVGMMDLFAQGMKHNLDPELMIAIFEREMKKMEEEGK